MNYPKKRGTKEWTCYDHRLYKTDSAALLGARWQREKKNRRLLWPLFKAKVKEEQV